MTVSFSRSANRPVKLTSHKPVASLWVCAPQFTFTLEILLMQKYNSVEFGFLSSPLTIETDNYDIIPLQDLEARILHVKEYTNRDGYIYPPQVSTVSIDPITGKEIEEIKNTKRPANFFYETASHTLTIKRRIVENELFFDESFIVHLIAFIYGTRLQLSRWKFDGRIPTKLRTNIIIKESTRLHFINHVYDWWSKQSFETQTKFTNVLYFYTRAVSLENEWDAFIHQYMTFDAIFSIFRELHKGKITDEKLKGNLNHKNRFKKIIGHYEMPTEESIIDKIYKARNEIFHEALWTGKMIGFGPDSSSIYLTHHLSRLNSRFICQLATYKNDYASSGWWWMGNVMFNQIPL